MKRIIAIIVSVVLVLSCTTALAYAKDGVLLGDADMDGCIKLGDCAMILRHIAGWEGLKIDLEAADVTEDGKITLSDVTTILRMFSCTF